MFGHPANMKKIMSLKKKYNFKIIEDCAESHGAIFNNKKEYLILMFLLNQKIQTK